MNKKYILFIIFIILSNSSIFAVKNYRKPKAKNIETQTDELQTEQAFQRGLTYYEHHAWQEALKYFKQAAEQDHTIAQYLVAEILYKDGNCDKNELFEAFEFCKLAKYKGFPKAIELYKKMQPDVVEKLLEESQKPIKINLPELLKAIQDKASGKEEGHDKEGNSDDDDEDGDIKTEKKDAKPIPDGMYI